MTWIFVYAATLVVGLVLAGVTGLIKDLRCLAHNLVVPHPDQHSAFLSLLGPRLAVGAILFGVVGLVASGRRTPDDGRTLLFAAAAGFVGLVVAVAVLRSRPARGAAVVRATVVRDIAPGGYGQVRFERAGGSVVLAAQSIDSVPIPAGSEVEVVDCTRSVVTVRKPTLG